MKLLAAVTLLGSTQQASAKLINIPVMFTSFKAAYAGSKLRSPVVYALTHARTAYVPIIWPGYGTEHTLWPAIR